jgi:hypothetical protein
VRWKESRWRAGNISVLGSGINHDELVKMVEGSGFGGIEVGGRRRASRVKRDEQAEVGYVGGKDIKEISLSPGRESIDICLSFKGLGEDDPDLVGTSSLPLSQL